MGVGTYVKCIKCGKHYYRPSWMGGEHCPDCAEKLYEAEKKGKKNE
jgi:DNA-directed RNA polymerase subunit RPC12/RpoP